MHLTSILLALFLSTTPKTDAVLARYDWDLKYKEPREEPFFGTVLHTNQQSIMYDCLVNQNQFYEKNPVTLEYVLVTIQTHHATRRFIAPGRGFLSKGDRIMGSIHPDSFRWLELMEQQCDTRSTLPEVVDGYLIRLDWLNGVRYNAHQGRIKR